MELNELDRTITPRLIIYRDRLWSLILPPAGGPLANRPVWVREYRNLDEHNPQTGQFGQMRVWHGKFTCRWYAEAIRADGTLVRSANSHWALSDAMDEAFILSKASDELLSIYPLIAPDEDGREPEAVQERQL